MNSSINLQRIFYIDEPLFPLDITNTTLETGETSTMVTGISEPESTTTTDTITTITTLKPRREEKPEAGSEGITSCESNVCRNGGTCLTSIDGFQCHCRYKYYCYFHQLTGCTKTKSSYSQTQEYMYIQNRIL